MTLKNQNTGIKKPRLVNQKKLAKLFVIVIDDWKQMLVVSKPVMLGLCTVYDPQTILLRLIYLPQYNYL